ncbi:hypothetical protein AA106555_1563 [Neokomagataea thailandica NBRC 106555]|uniref:DUF2252 domain-containing protein n=2 Tax=Neokomagataea TaxID=1223423 RepID=A0A4Y6V789_9PROT|nr:MULTISPECIES: DUF2252 domain-containing protein [Neokomagataea]QDH25244.1 DUF2252 domain-containing protein [Neokomagataea tanensis]GBR54132.1 hypothetical protein AA106555_1563 [Neokomagataea thailandica NBRC 106555]
MSETTTQKDNQPSLKKRTDSHNKGTHLRKRTPRSAQAEWRPHEDRRSAVEILAEQGQNRIAELVPVRYERMRVSPFTFLRGAAAVMAADLANTPFSGPRVQSCGDCHLANFGSYASPEGVPVFDINDFDETLEAPFEWDVKRLGASFILAGDENGLSPKASRALSESMALSYAQHMAYLANKSPLEVWADRVDFRDAIAHFEDKKVRARAEKLLSQRLTAAKGHFGLILGAETAPKLKEKPPLVMHIPGREDIIRKAFDRYLKSQPPERAILLRRYALKDVMFKVVGVGSVGTFCAIGLFATPDGEYLLLQIKEAQTSVMAPFAGASPFKNQGERVVTGQRMMQAVSDVFLGWTHTKADPTAEAPDLSGSGRQFYVRRLKDGRLADIGADVAQEGLADYAKLCGRTLARAHARSGDVSQISGYLGKGKAFADAIASFSDAYAAQTRTDWELFTAALDRGALTPPTEDEPSANNQQGN